MAYNEEGGETIPKRQEIPHYHGDGVRVLFVISALLIIIAQSTGAELPLSTASAVVSAAILVIAAGITNPAQFGIHWFNAFLSAIGVIVFGIAAVSRYRTGINFFDPSFVYVEILALLSLVALYLTTRTIRGIHQRARRL